MALTYPDHTYDLIVIGRGSAAAIYLNNLRKFHGAELRKDLPAISILVIGKDDPWQGERGYAKGQYIEKINQARQLFEHGTRPKASMVDTAVDRLEWARENQALIAEVSGGNVVDGEVTSVAKHMGDGFLVKTSGAQYRARKVVIATGAGIESNERQYHHVPDQVDQFRRSGLVQAKRVMDLDQFQRGENNTRDGRGKVVGVIGPAAGTDAIMEAATRGYERANVLWFVAPGADLGTKLTWDVKEAGIQPTFTAAEAGKDHPAGCVVRYENMILGVGGRRAVKVELNGGRSFEVDYLVYAVGQRGGGINRAVPNAHTGKPDQVPFVERGLKLEPVYDTNQRFSELGSEGSGGAWQHMVGLQLEGSTDTVGITIIGSAAVQAARGVKHNYLDRDYEKLLATADRESASFRNVANECFALLFKATSFSDMVSGDITRATDPDYTKLCVQYLERLMLAIDDGLGSVIGKELRGDAIRAAHLKRCKALAQEICYMFQLRVKAARYLKAAQAEPSALLSQGLKRTLPETVSDSRLIGGMQRNIQALNQQVNVEHVRNERGVNFLEDQQTLALYIAVHYPNIAASKANQLVAEIVKARKDKLRGFTPAEMGQWDYRLGAEDRQAQKAQGYAYGTYFR